MLPFFDILDGCSLASVLLLITAVWALGGWSKESEKDSDNNKDSYTCTWIERICSYFKLLLLLLLLLLLSSSFFFLLLSFLVAAVAVLVVVVVVVVLVVVVSVVALL